MQIVEWEPKPRKFYKIQQALVELGATKYEVYARYQKQRRKFQPYSICSRFTYDEFKTWVHSLYRDAVKNYHPDLHPSLSDSYKWKMAQINEARDWALGWLESNKNRMKQY